MKKLRIDSLFFIVFIAVLGLANLLNFSKPTVSRLENRALKQKPSFSLSTFFKGEYTRQYEEYYSDTFVLRDQLVRASKDIKEAMSFLGPDISIVTAYDDQQFPDNDPDGTGASDNGNTASGTANNGASDVNTLNPGENANSADNASQEDNPSGSASPTPSDTATPQPTETPRDYGDGQNLGYWLVVDGQAVQLFKFNKESCEYYAQVLNKYREKLGDDVKIYSIIPPTASEFLKLKKYKGITDSQNDALGFLKSKLDKSITSVNVYDSLNQHKEEYIYFRTDHHWTALGAYYGYKAFMESKGEQPVPLEDYDAVDLGDFLGSTYTKTLDKSLEKNPDQLIAYKPFTDYEYLMYSGSEEKRADVIDMKYANDITNKYLVFISSGGATWSVIKTDVHNGKRLLVIKDSFGNALVPFLLPHYEEIYVVDARFYSINSTGKNIIEFIHDHDINELVFVFYMEDVNWHKFMTGVENLLGSNN